MELVSQSQCFGGVQSVYSHRSDACKCKMTFGVFLPPQAKTHKVPTLWFLAGLTCTHENAMTKAGLQSHAARHGLALVFPDTSPRGDDVSDDEAYDLGKGAGFFLNATREPWSRHYRMYDYIVEEMPPMLEAALPLNGVYGVTGHSMGGHGALTIAIRNPDKFRSLSAFAPIVNPTRSDWGRKQFSAYLGDDEAQWGNYDACLLLAEHGWQGEILIDQGASDQFLDLLRPEAMAGLIAESRQSGVVRMQAGYDHSYYFVSSFGGDHVDWHAARLHDA